MNKNFNKSIYVKNKDSLEEDLKRYSLVFQKSIIEYLYSLLNLEFSVVRDFINEEERSILSNFEIYKEISIYNIYYKALKLFTSDNNKDNIIINDYGFPISLLDVNYSFGEKNIPLFRFDVDKNLEAKIFLYKEDISQKRINAELERVFNKLYDLYDEKNPYYSVSDYDKKRIELGNYFYKILLEDYGLKDWDFQFESRQYGDNSYSDESLLNQTLVKRIPNLVIKSNIK